LTSENVLATTFNLSTSLETNSNELGKKRQKSNPGANISDNHGNFLEFVLKMSGLASNLRFEGDNTSSSGSTNSNYDGLTNTMDALRFSIHNAMSVLAVVVSSNRDLILIIWLSSKIIFFALNILSRNHKAVSWHFVSKLELNKVSNY
jgi:hypothetical protein